MTAMSGGITPAARPWGLWARQVRGIVRIELRKVLFSRWSLIGWGLALLPVMLLSARVAVVVALGWSTPGSTAADEQSYAAVYQALILRLCVFFGCLVIFINLFRGEIHDRTLHYYLLAPVRRPVLVAGKFLGGALGAALLFGGATLGTRLLLLATHDAAGATRWITDGAWLANTLAYAGETLLACLSYGAAFLVIGMLPVNPIVPAILLLGWESANVFLPATLQLFSVVFYLDALNPVPLDLGPVAILSTPPSVPVAVVVLSALTAALLGVAMCLGRRMEVTYGEE